MPYIEQGRRAELDTGSQAETSGELNYRVTTMVDDWLGEAPGYERLNAAIGVLDCAKMELYRRVLAPYEDLKLEENGDAYRRRGSSENRSQTPSGTPCASPLARFGVAAGDGLVPYDGTGGD